MRAAVDGKAALATGNSLAAQNDEAEPVLRQQRVIYDFGTARVIDTGVSPFDGDDIVVQQRDGSGWKQVMRYNSLSNDYAYSSASDDARAIAAKGGAK